MLHTSDFDFELPNELIASHPLHDRDASRMLVVQNGLQDKHIRDFIDFLQPGDVVVFNNSRVIPARFVADDHEITLHTAVDDKNWWGLCKKFNKINVGDTLTMQDGTKITVVDKDEESGLLLRFDCENVFDLLNKYGKMPLPPYMKREEETEDRERYQTVYAQPLGSMAAPTAGLHFTEDLLSKIEQAGAKIVKVTLHVGAGTWMPVKTENLNEHKMHSEWCCITPEQAEIINNAKRVIAVGTTSLRTLESAHTLVLQKMSKDKVPLLRRGARRVGWSFDKGKFGVNFNLPLNRELAERAKELRKAGSLPEALLWKEIKGKQINGLDFDRQKVIGNYIVDFFCEELGLVIEIDDKSHDMKEQHDEKREKYLKNLGLEILHISAKDILKNPADFANWLKTTPAVGHPSAGGEFASLQQKILLPRVLPICQTTDIFITPGYEFGAVDVLLTNFHLPKSTLFMLVSAFAGLENMKDAYNHAVTEKYRFFSYGDCCLLFKNDKGNA